MSDVALYFPYVNLPGDEWVKAAALHWPQLGRIRPESYSGLRDSDTVKRLRDELDFVIDVRPDWGRWTWVDEDMLARADHFYDRRQRAETEAQIDVLFYDFLDRYQDELIGRYGTAALATVLPRDLADVPVERIIEARRRLLPQLLQYREFLDSLAPDFVAISEVRDPEVRAAKLRNHVQSRIAHPLAEMERTLGRLGLAPVRAVLSLQTLAPPAALGVLANAAHLPSAVTGAGIVAGCLAGAMSSAFDQRRQALAGHPTGYLLNLRHELGPSDTVAQVRSAIRRAIPRRPGRR